MGFTKYVALAALMRNERRSPQALAELQGRRLQRLVRHACAHVPLYARLFREAGVDPDDIRGAADLQRLPVIDKDLLRSLPIEDVIDCRRRLDDLVEKRTSGSSGSPFRFFADPAFDAQCKAQYLRPYLSNGRNPFDRVLRFTAFPEDRPRWFQRLGLMRETLVGCSAPADEQLAALQVANADIVQGYPSVLSALAARIDPQAPGFRYPRMVFTDSELLTPAARRLIDETFGAPVFDVYGTYETDNIGYECSEHSGYHLAIDCVIVEVLENGAPVAAGESGDLVCTVLGNYGMPFIRYSLGDVAALSPEACRCGRSLPLMSIVEGRRVDCVRLPDGGLQSPMRFLGALDSIDELALEYQVVQSSPGDFLVKLVPRRELADDDQQHIAGLIRAQLPDARVTIQPVGHIPREASGKRRTFTSRI
jgi:phenylacetate-CoA ligase